MKASNGVDYTILDNFLCTVAGKLWKSTKQGILFFKSPPKEWILKFNSQEWLLSSASVQHLRNMLADDDYYNRYPYKKVTEEPPFNTLFLQSQNGKVFFETIKSSTHYFDHVDIFLKNILAVESDWLISKYGTEWMKSKTDAFWTHVHFEIFSKLDLKISFTLFSFTAGKAWSQNLSFMDWTKKNYTKWLPTNDGQTWLTTSLGINWTFFSHDSVDWFLESDGKKFVQNTKSSEHLVLKHLKLQKYSCVRNTMDDFIRSDSGNVWLNTTVDGLCWLESSVGKQYDNLNVFRNVLPLL
jgi:hypothetical protein